MNFNGAGSSDADGSIVSYSWNFGNGQTATGPLASTTFATQGTYLVRLTVVDNRGASRNTTVTIVAGATNVKPVAVITALPTSGPAPLLVQLRQQPVRTIRTARSSATPGTSATDRPPSGTTTQVNYTVAGTYTVTLTVTDNRGAKTTATETIVVDPPVAVRDRVRLQYTGGVTYSFDGKVNGTGLRVQP